MSYEFFKIVDQRHVDDLLDGKLYMNTLNYFRCVEGNMAQGDPFEGVCGTIRKNQSRQYGFNFGQEIAEKIKGNIQLISDNYGYQNVFCLYCLKKDDEHKVIERPSPKLEEFNDREERQKVVVRIKEPENFLERLNCAIEREINQHTFEYGAYGLVQYSTAWTNADGPGTRSVFHKEPSYAYQKEWRLTAFRNGWKNEAYTLSVGSLRDICQEISLDQFLNHLDDLFPGYTVSDSNELLEQGAYRMFGTVDAVSRWTNMYMPHAEMQVTRSDQAQADWHYTQYLQLTDRQSEIDSYLEKQLQKCKDMDHMNLLVAWRLSCNQWVKATDAYMFMKDYAREEIEKDPGAFFFSLHTILMQHGEVADAAKLFHIARSEFSLPEDLQDTMSSDYLSALGFYDQVIPVYERIIQRTQDPIVEYYLAVCYLHLLKFAEAGEHLANYQKYYCSTKEFAHKANELEKLIASLRDGIPFEERTSEHPLMGLKWDARIESALDQAKRKGLRLVAGIDSLYQVETADRWNYLKALKEIEVMPLTIVRVIELYRETGYIVFFRILRHLAEMENVKICSPKLEYYLAIDEAKPDLPPHYKMELSMLAQVKSEEPEP